MYNKTSDMEYLLSASYIEWDKLMGADFLVTGATGLIGSMAVRTLLHSKKKRKSGGKIYIASRNFGRMKKLFGDSLAENGLVPVIGDIRDIEWPQGSIDYVIHGASATASRYMVTHPVETLMTSVAGTDRVLSGAAAHPIKGMVYLSSMEVYGYTAPEQNPVSEEMLGTIDLMNVRSCYPLGKRICENLCVDYVNEYKVPVCVARLAQVFGNGVSPEDNRVFVSFAKSALKHEDIVLHTQGNSMGNYCYTADAVGALLCLLTKGNPGEAYNVANEANSMKIREMAELVADGISGGRSQVVFDIPEDKLKYGFAPDTNMVLTAEKIRKLGWSSEVGLLDMYKRMIAGWQAQNGEDTNAGN